MRRYVEGGLLLLVEGHRPSTSPHQAWEPSGRRPGGSSKASSLTLRQSPDRAIVPIFERAAYFGHLFADRICAGEVLARARLRAHVDQQAHQAVEHLGAILSSR